MGFSRDYIENTFFAWYKNNRANGNSFINSLAKDENGRAPSTTVVREWIQSYGWEERADALDVETTAALTREVIDDRIEMFKRHAEVGTALIEEGMKYLQKNGISSDAAAIKAIDVGIATQRISVGQAALGVSVFKMQDAQLDKELRRLLGNNKENEIDAEVTVGTDEIDEGIA